MKCPECSTKITAKHYDPQYEIYECPKCGGAFEADDLEEAENGTSPRHRRISSNNSTNIVDTMVGNGRAGQGKRGSHTQTNGKKVIARGKKKRNEAAADAEALAKFEAEALKPVKTEKEVKHRDEVSTGQIIEVVADEIEAIWQENGWPINRLNAREFFAMNIVRPLRMDATVHFRDRETPAKYCKEHAA